jgi:hypothetical protein
MAHRPRRARTAKTAVAAGAATAAPQAMMTQTSKGKGRPRGGIGGLLKTVAIIALGGAVALGAQHARQSPGPATLAFPAASQSAPAPAPAPATTSNATSNASVLGSLPSDATSARPALGGSSLARQRPVAQRLATRDGDAADRIAALGTKSPAVDALATALRAVERGYRNAASAAGTGNAAAYSAAIAQVAAAKQLTQDAIARVRGQQGGGTGSGQSSSGGGSSSSSCAGDSTSDDPSDDQCSNGQP